MFPFLKNLNQTKKHKENEEGKIKVKVWRKKEKNKSIQPIRSHGISKYASICTGD